jgi:HSP20 family protein
MPTDIERQNPFREVLALRNRIDQLFDNLVSRPRGEWMAAIFDYPAMNMYQSNGKVLIEIPLPGVNPEEVELTVTGNTLMVKGEHKTKEEIKEEDYYRHEMHYGAFTRAVALPDTIDVAKPEAVFENGVLTVSFPKTVQTPPARIDIKVAEPQMHEVGQPV